MKLYQSWFEWVQQGKQILEVRLYDEKRRNIQLGDTIQFTRLPDEQAMVSVRVIWLLIYPSFADLFQEVPAEYWNAKDLSIQERIDLCRKIYSEEDEKKYGVVWIRIERI